MNHRKGLKKAPNLGSGPRLHMGIHHTILMLMDMDRRWLRMGCNRAMFDEGDWVCSDENNPSISRCFSWCLKICRWNCSNPGQGATAPYGQVPGYTPPYGGNPYAAPYGFGEAQWPTQTPLRVEFQWWEFSFFAMLLLGFGNEQRFFQMEQLHLLPPKCEAKKSSILVYLISNGLLWHSVSQGVPDGCLRLK